MFCWISIFGGLLIMMGHHPRALSDVPKSKLWVGGESLGAQFGNCADFFVSGLFLGLFELPPRKGSRN
jgi:hypothetical protein